MVPRNSTLGNGGGTGNSNLRDLGSQKLDLTSLRGTGKKYLR